MLLAVLAAKLAAICVVLLVTVALVATIDAAFAATEFVIVVL